jgi:transcriptional regulator with XRE-family HTH domain
MKQTENRLREYRKRKGLNQKEVGKHLGFKTGERIGDWEKGISYPHVLNFLKLIDLYGATARELYPKQREPKIDVTK